MNKKLIALAVAGACVVPEAMAQTANPVTLYGRAYATFESVEAKGSVGAIGPVVRRNRVVDQSSLLGVRGTEDLGGGLKAFFQLETAWKLDQNDTTFAARNSGVGLQGAWGSVLMGRWDVPFKVTTIAVDPFGDLTIGGITSALSGSGVGNQQAVFDRRDQNVVQYWSPSWMGLAVRVSYSANEGKTSAPCAGAAAGTVCNPRSEGGSITYTGGPIYVGYAYHQLRDMTFGSFAVTATTPPPFTFQTPLLPKNTAHAIFGNFTFGPIKIGAIYEKLKRGNVSTAASTAGTVIGFSDQKAWMGNVVFTAGNSQFIYQYQKAQDGGERIITSATVLQPAEPNCTVNAVGYQYNFTRRTFFLGEYSRVKNNATATCNFGTGDERLPITAGQNPQGFSLGLRHIF